MHDEHDHGAHGSTHDHPHGHGHPSGHNGPPGTAKQWQTPHLPHGHTHDELMDPGKQDLDLVETAFLEGFSAASDAASFLRLAGIPFIGETESGERLHLLRVESDDKVDIGAVTPILGGGGVTYQPLPGRLVSRRKALSFVYHDGASQRRLDFNDARSLTDRSGFDQFDLKRGR